MNIRTTYLRDVDSDEGDLRVTTTLTTDDGVATFSIGEGEPEDMTLFRDLSDAYAVHEMLKAAYLAGKRGEDLEVEES